MGELGCPDASVRDRLRHSSTGDVLRSGQAIVRRRWVRMAVALTACVFCAVLGFVSVAQASSREPATVFQCRLKYSMPSKQEACIKSLGSSCAHPVMSELSRALEHLGNRHMEIWEEVSKDETPEYVVGPHVEPPEVTNYVSISVTTDSKMTFCEVELITYEGPNGEVVKHHLLHTGPHEGGAYILALTGGGSFLVRTYGRYTHPPHRSARS